jgi:hypothetical protein
VFRAAVPQEMEELIRGLDQETRFCR